MLFGLFVTVMILSNYFLQIFAVRVNILTASSGLKEDKSSKVPYKGPITDTPSVAGPYDKKRLRVRGVGLRGESRCKHICEFRQYALATLKQWWAYLSYGIAFMSVGFWVEVHGPRSQRPRSPATKN